MATREEILAGLQDVADRGMEDRLTEKGRMLFDAAVSDGLIKPRRGITGAITEMASPRFQEDFPEVEFNIGMPTDPAEAQRWIDELSSNQVLRPRVPGQGLLGKYVGAQVTTDRYGRPIVETTSGEKRYLNRGGFSVGDVPRAIESIAGGIKEAAPYIAGGGVTGVARGALTQGGIGLASELTEQAGKLIEGEETDSSQLATTPLIAMGADIFGRGIFGIGSKIYSSIVGRRAAKVAPNKIIDKDTGQITPDAIQQMRSVATDDEIGEVTFRALMDEVEKGNLTEQQMAEFARKMDEYIVSGKATPAQAERYNLFKRLNIEPTRAQVTRSASDFQTQQELAKTSGPVLGALEQQQAQISKAFDTMEAGTGGVVRAEASPIQQAVIDKAVKLDNEIGAMYKSADEMVQGAPPINIQNYLEKLVSFKSLNQRSQGTYKALIGQMEDLGYSVKKGKIIGGNKPVTAKQAESIRQGINSLYEGANPIAKTMIRDAKEVLDMSVGRSLGKDAYKQARKAYSDFRQGLNPEQLSKFSRNEKSLIRDLLEERMPTEQVFDRVIAGRGYTAKDLRALKDYIVGSGDNISTAGAQAWADLRAEALQYIKKNAFGGPLGETGYQTLTRTRLQSALKRIGDNKLKVIFTPNELKFIDDLVKISQIIEPVGGTALGRGPSAQAIAQAERLLTSYTGVIGGAVLNMGKSLISAITKSGAERSALTPVTEIAETTAREAARRASEAARLTPTAISRAGAASAGLTSALEDRR